MASPAMALWILSLRANSGAAAWRTGSAPITAKLRSGTGGLPACGWVSRRAAFVTQAGKERLELLPDLGAAGQPAPVQTDDAHQLVAAVNRRLVVFASLAQ